MATTFLHFRIANLCPVFCFVLIVGVAGCTEESQPTSPAPARPNLKLLVTGFDLASVDAGGHTTCGLTSVGQAYCWGHNFFGTVGNGTPGANVLVPTAVVSPAGSATPLEFSTISVGYEHVCAVTKSGQAFCWGRNNLGQLGIGIEATGVDMSVPTPVEGGLRFATVTAGRTHTCALDTNGLAYCWGNAYGGALGIGTVPPAFCGSMAPCSPEPVAVAPPVGSDTPLTFTSISAGEAFTCGVAKGGQTFCWGINENGELGIGSTSLSVTEKLVPTPIASGLLFTAVSAGGDHACALAKGGTLYCWGKNEFGEVGNGTTGLASAPVPVIGGHTFTSVSASLAYDGGEVGTCAIAKGGDMYCWGENGSRRLGTGTGGGIATVPVAVAGGHTFTVVTTGIVTTCGVTKANGAYCWGTNTEGQIGDGTSQTTYAAPTPVSPPAS